MTASPRPLRRLPGFRRELGEDGLKGYLETKTVTVAMG